ncbi:MAG TPA: EI24 domain-containing protein [Spirochaetota bacterium]|nr:EI24 domain-containing protein [Spirochaetota bacterium]HPR48432.1 EI24 domain-containing protein [Spirochaetota bacterium]
MKQAGPMKRMTYTEGLRAIGESVKLLRRHKKLLLYFIIPFFINTALLCGLAYGSFAVLAPWLKGMVTGDAWYLEAVRFIITPLVTIITLAVMVLLYSLLGNIITSPFNEFLSEAVEKRLAPGTTDDAPLTPAVFFRDLKTMGINTIKLFLLMIAINAALLIVNIIPVAGGIVYAPLSFMNTVFFLGMQFFEYPLSRRRMAFKEKMKLAWSHRYGFMGVGTGFFLMSFVPLVGFLGLNLATMAATLLYVNHATPEQPGDHTRT